MLKSDRASRDAGAWRIAAWVMLACAAAPAFGQLRADQPPPESEGVEIIEKINAQIPLGLQFTDQHAAPVTLAKYFDGKRPVILTLNYYGCPMLCGEQLKGLLATLKELKWTAGNEFTILTVSFEPLEGPSLAFAKRQSYLAGYGRPEAAGGWHFLTGSRESIRALTETVGFGYKWNPERREWMHSAALILITPNGRVARYLGGLSYDPQTLRMSLVEASEGKVGSLADQFFMWCFHWDPKTGKYAAVAVNIMTMGGLVTMLVVGGGLWFFWRREVRRTVPAALPIVDSGPAVLRPE